MEELVLFSRAGTTWGRSQGLQDRGGVKGQTTALSCSGERPNTEGRLRDGEGPIPIVSVAGRPGGRQPGPGRSSFEPKAQTVHGALPEAAFKERRKIHDVVMDGIELALRRRGYSSSEDLKAKFDRKGR